MKNPSSGKFMNLKHRKEFSILNLCQRKVNIYKEVKFIETGCTIDAENYSRVP